MISVVFALRDSKLDAFMAPMASPNEAVATRMFRDLLRQDNEFSAHPEDFDLYRLGTFNAVSGEIEPCAPKFVVGGSSLVEKAN